MTIEQLEAFSETKPELRYLTEEIIKYMQANPGGSPGGGALLSATVELTDAQIKASPSAGIELLADVAAGKFPMIVSGFAKITNAAGAYTNVDLADSYLAICYSKLGTVNNDAVYIKINAEMQFFTIADNKVNQFLPRTKNDAGYNENYSPMFYPLSTYDGTGLQVCAYNNLGDFTGGNAANTLKITVYYVIVDL